MIPPYSPQEEQAEPPVIFSLPANQDSSEAIVPVPLPKEIKRAGMVYREFSRSGDIAIYCGKGKGSRIEYEVIKVQLLPAQELGAHSYPVREAFPKP